MNDENTYQPDANPNGQAATPVPPSRSGDRTVVQPSETVKQELQSQQIQPEAPRSIAPSQPVSTPPVMPKSANIYPEPASNQMQVGISASQMGFNKPKSKLLDLSPKQLLIKGGLALVVLGGIFAVLVMTNIVALSEFKTVRYDNPKDGHYKFDFYTKHGSKRLQSGNTQFVSKVSKDGKFPLAVSINTAEASGYNRAKDCAGFTKVLDVQNNSLNQKISVCDFGKQGNLPAGVVYVAGFMVNDQSHMITITQDYGSIDLSSKSGAQESLARFGMESYRADVERIVSSIKVE